MMLRRKADRNPPAHVVLTDDPPTIPAPPERHWFVPEAPDGFYCAACGLPESNARHASRSAA